MTKTDMQSTYYTIYQTTNEVNGKTYIGKHVTDDLNDGYLGSGKLLKRAIARYSVENFRKEILHVFDNEADMNAKERGLVTEEFVLQETNYNLCVGGQGGFSYINGNGLNNYKKDYEAVSKALKGRKNERYREWLAEQRANGRQIGGGPTFKGKKHSEETKRKISEAMKKRRAQQS